MNQNSELEPLVEDACTFIQFVNMIGDISESVYLAMHPEENDSLLVQFEIECDSQVRMPEYLALYAPAHTKLQEAYA